jgi:hypothetical protein
VEWLIPIALISAVAFFWLGVWTQKHLEHGHDWVHEPGESYIKCGCGETIDFEEL